MLWGVTLPETLSGQTSMHAAFSRHNVSAAAMPHVRLGMDVMFPDLPFRLRPVLNGLTVLTPVLLVELIGP